jgi:ABC-2 type transport system ATP-binding protein
MQGKENKIMSNPQITVQNLSKTFRVPVRDAGLFASVGSLLTRSYREVNAVRDISFSIEKGEMVGFLGPNGAGKTTTLKMLAGLLYPTSGNVCVAGFTPWERKHDYLRRISMVLGNKSQMLWDIPPRDSFRVLGEIYRVPPKQLVQTLDELFELLDMSALLAKPVRTLSLGERMKCELVGALLYQPSVLFLDEPTLGLDISMQRRVRQFIAEYNRRSSATILLTSHYMADVEALCSRVILISSGTLLYDGNLQALAHTLAPHKLLRILVDEAYVEQHTSLTFPVNATVVEHENASWTLSVSQDDVPHVASALLNALPITDLSIEEPPIETVIDIIYQGGTL